MVEVRKALGIESALHISDINLRLPSDHSWIAVPDSVWADGGSVNLQRAFDDGLVDMRISGGGDVPTWYLKGIEQHVRIPVELLDSLDEVEIVEKLNRIRKDAHPTVWEIIRRKLFALERRGDNRSKIVGLLRPTYL